jgi:predicted ester cyclase
MSSQNVETVRKIQACWNEGRIDDLDQYFAPSFDNSQNLPPGMPAGLAGAKAAAEFAKGAFSDRKVEEIEVVDGGDAVFIRNKVSAVNSGGVPWIGVPANGRSFQMESWSVYRFDAGGKVVSHAGLNDMMALKRQLEGEAQRA